LIVATDLKEARKEFEREYIREKLIASNWNITKAAEILGIPRTYLHQKIKKFSIEI